MNLEVTATEFSFEPDTWTVPADTDVTVTFRNEGTQLRLPRVSPSVHPD
jgi:hypothetical protein